MADQAAPPAFVWKFPAGVDNQSREYEVPDTALRECVNLDVTRAGGLRVRDGLRLLSVGAFHSLYAPISGQFGLACVNGYLSRISASGEVTPLTAVSANRLHYAEHNSEIYWSDGSTVGRVTAAGAASFWGLAVPPAPLCTWRNGNPSRVTMTARYQGVESGAPEPVTLRGTVKSVTTPTAPAGVDFVIYSTRADGTTLRQIATIAAGANTSVSVNYRGKALQSLYAIRPPAGHLLCSYHGRIWIASSSTLWWTAAESPHWVFPASNFIQFDSAITLLQPVVDGLYVATATQTFFLAGSSPSEFQQREVSGFGVIPGAATSHCPPDVFAANPPQPAVVWVDSGGVLCVGRASGQMQRLSVNRFAADVRAVPWGSMVYRQQHGIRQFVVGLAEPAAASFADVPVLTTVANGLTGA